MSRVTGPRTGDVVREGSPHCASEDEVLCPARNFYECSRADGHEPPHVACGTNRLGHPYVIRIWDDTQMVDIDDHGVGLSLGEPTPRPGDFIVVATPGVVPWLIRLITRSPYNHVALYTGPRPEGDIIESKTRRGPQWGSWKTQYAHRRYLWSTNCFNITLEQREKIVAAAISHLGVGYNFLDIADLFLSKVFGVHLPQRWLARLEARREICSQDVDLDYELAGIQLYADGRPTGSVTPGDLAKLIQARRRDPLFYWRQNHVPYGQEGR